MMIPLEAFFLLRMATDAMVGWSPVARGNLRVYGKAVFWAAFVRCLIYLLPTLFRWRSTSHFCHFSFLAMTSFHPRHNEGEGMYEGLSGDTGRFDVRIWMLVAC